MSQHNWEWVSLGARRLLAPNVTRDTPEDGVSKNPWRMKSYALSCRYLDVPIKVRGRRQKAGVLKWLIDR